MGVIGDRLPSKFVIWSRNSEIYRNAKGERAGVHLRDLVNIPPLVSTGHPLLQEKSANAKKTSKTPSDNKMEREVGSKEQIFPLALPFQPQKASKNALQLQAVVLSVVTRKGKDFADLSQNAIVEQNCMTRTSSAYTADTNELTETIKDHEIEVALVFAEDDETGDLIAQDNVMMDTTKDSDSTSAAETPWALTKGPKAKRGLANSRQNNVWGKHVAKPSRTALSTLRHTKVKRGAA
jgi:hypothetical protein